MASVRNPDTPWPVAVATALATRADVTPGGTGFEAREADGITMAMPVTRPSTENEPFGE